MDLTTATLTIDGDHLAIKGRFDAHSAPDIREWMEARLTRELRSRLRDREHADAVHLTIDLAEVDFIDSTALAELVRGMKRARLTGGDVVLTRPSETVRVILELTRLDAAFTIVAPIAHPAT
jgi:anti-sigma B factor antagonist